MYKWVQRFVVLPLLMMVPLAVQAEAPTDYRSAKELLRDHVYYDRNKNGAGTLYCGCDWSWRGESGGRILYNENCSAEIDSYGSRADRTEWEHIVPISRAAGDWACWQDGGRGHCADEDPRFALMYADPHNLTPSIGAINAQRSNHPYGAVSGHHSDYGACSTAYDENRNILEPRDSVKGFVARTYFYMADRYALADDILPPDTERLMIRWDRQYPVSDWERQRNRRIAKETDNENPYVTGDRQWREGDSTRGHGFKGAEGPYSGNSSNDEAEPDEAIIGNTNSDIYHLPGCGSYHQVGEDNRQYFDTEKAAREAGFRKAGNC